MNNRYVDKNAREHRVDGPSDVFDESATPWDQITEAQDGELEARAQLTARYSAFAYRYLLRELGDSHAAADLSQDLIVRLLQRRFRGLARQRGSFRAYLRRALIHLIADHYKQRKRQPKQLGDDDIPAPVEALTKDFELLWRKKLLERTLEDLGSTGRNGKLCQTIIDLRRKRPRSSSMELAKQLGFRLRKSISPEAYRLSLHRARQAFADLLVTEVSRDLGDPSPDQVIDELIELDLLKFCRSAVQKRRYVRP